MCLCQRCCRRTESRPARPHTLLLCLGEVLGEECVLLHYHARQSVSPRSSSESKICHWLRTCFHNLLLSCRFLHMTRPYHPTRSIQPPSNSVQTDALYTEPAEGHQISLGHQDISLDLDYAPTFCCRLQQTGDCVLCLGPVSDHRNLHKKKREHNQDHKICSRITLVLDLLFGST